MATVRDLYTKVSEETALEFEECRHLCRMMQQAGLLPKGRRGGWKDAPHVSAGDCAYFLLALAGTRNARTRTEKGVIESVERLGSLVWRDGRYRETLLERLTLILNCELGWSYLTPTTTSIWNSERWPTAELEYRWGIEEDERQVAFQIFGEGRSSWTDRDSEFWEQGALSDGFQFNDKLFAIFFELLEGKPSNFVIYAHGLTKNPSRQVARLERPLRARVANG